MGQACGGGCGGVQDGARRLDDVKLLLDGVQMLVNSKPDVVVTIMQLDKIGKEDLVFSLNSFTLREIKMSVLFNLKGTPADMALLTVNGSETPKEGETIAPAPPPASPAASGGMMASIMGAMGMAPKKPAVVKESYVFPIDVICDLTKREEANEVLVAITKFEPQDAKALTATLSLAKAQFFVQTALSQALFEVAEDLKLDSKDAAREARDLYAQENDAVGGICRIGGPQRSAKATDKLTTKVGEEVEAPMGKLNVTIISADNLKTPVGSVPSQPYVSFSTDTDNPSAQHYKSPPARADANPVWNEDLVMNDYIQGKAINFEVWCAGSETETFIGRARLESNRFHVDHVCTMDLPLQQQGQTSGEPGKQQGPDVASAFLKVSVGGERKAVKDDNQDQHLQAPAGFHNNEAPVGFHSREEMQPLAPVTPRGDSKQVAAASGAFISGDQVAVLIKGESHAGQVVDVNPDNTYKIQTAADQSFENKVVETRLRMIEEFKEKQNIEIENAGQWYPGTIGEVCPSMSTGPEGQTTRTTTYKVEYVDGPDVPTISENDVPAHRLKSDNKKRQDVKQEISARTHIEPKREISVKIVSASGLRNADMVGKSDPYCIVKVDVDKAQEQQTSVKQNTLEPVWNEDFLIADYEAGKSLVFHVLDKDFGGSDKLGDVKLPHDQFLPNGTAGTIELKLENAIKGKQGTDAKLKVEVHVGHAESATPATANPEPARQTSG